MRTCKTSNAADSAIHFCLTNYALTDGKRIKSSFVVVWVISVEYALVYLCTNWIWNHLPSNILAKCNKDTFRYQDLAKLTIMNPIWYYQYKSGISTPLIVTQKIYLHTYSKGICKFVGNLHFMAIQWPQIFFAWGSMSKPET